jgi:micrococcal nuclease
MIPKRKRLLMRLIRTPNLLITSGLLLLALVPDLALAQTAGKVISIGDGDTIRVRSATGATETIRFACIDSPELGQTPHGVQSRQRLEQIIPVGTSVSLKPQTTDRYGRTVAEVFKGNLNVNLSMVQEGRAVAYRQYLDQCDAARYLAAEQSARQRRLAFWSQGDPVMPWDFRKGVRPVVRKPVQIAPAAAQSSKCDRAYPDVCIPPGPPDLDCSDISDRRFRVVGADPHKFDGNRDGVGCE